MDSPLNVAHQQSRKADMMFKASRYEEAVYCHQRAADHLLDAMHVSTSNHALESLSLQHQYHLKQQNWIRERQQRLERIQEQKAQKRENCISQGTQTEPSIPTEYDYQAWCQNGSFSSRDQVDGASSEHSIHQTMTETDSLLEFLIHRKQPSLGTPSIDQFVNRVFSSDCSSNSSTKTQKDEKIIVEELRVQNEDLRKHLILLLKEIEETKRKNQSLQNAIEQQETSKTLGAEEFVNMDNETLKLASLELPPLEMPEFDFSSLNEECLLTDKSSIDLT